MMMLKKNLVLVASGLSLTTAMLGLGNYALPAMANAPKSVQVTLIAKVKQLQESAAKKSEQNDFAGAISDYTAALKLDPKNIELYEKRAYLYNLTNDYKNAVASLDQAIKINPNVYHLHASRAASRIAMADFKGGIADLTMEFRLHPSQDLSGLYAIRARAYQSIGEHQKAIADFTRELTFKDIVSIGNSGLVLSDRAASYLKLGNKKAAIQDLKAALAVFKEQGVDGNQQETLEKLKALE
jgi:tetratricopeptide (TPR) repeat protein